MRPPLYRRKYARMNRATPKTTSIVSHGASGRSPATMTSSTMIFVTSGVNDAMRVPPMATPNAMNACFLCGAM
jgi:hypothetical protein